LPSLAPVAPLGGGEADRDPTLAGALERLGMAAQEPRRSQRAGADVALVRATELAARMAAERRKR
jgi:hypothetical protein